jgi:hypothetical protein
MLAILSLLSQAVSSVQADIPAWIYDLPFVEGAILLILATITVYRKRLSANDKYRSPNITASKAVIHENMRQSSRSNGRTTMVDFFPDLPTTSFAHVVQSAYQLSKPKSKDEALSNIRQNFPDRIGFNSLTQDNLWHLIELLPTEEIYRLSASCKSLRDELYRNDSLWERLWISRYTDLWQHPAIRAIREKRAIFWDPAKNYGNPQQGWRNFYREFELSWKDWLLAGACSSEYCILALHGSILDVTAFLPSHPGSLESLMDYAGGDATEQFLDVGHSSNAYHLSLNYTIYNSTLEADMAKQTVEFERKLHHSYDLTSSLTIVSKKKITKFAARMKYCAIKLEENTPSNSVSHGEKMMPSVEGYHDCSAFGEHVGRCRACWDPLEQRWYVWWTCCGRGWAVDGYHDFLAS